RVASRDGDRSGQAALTRSLRLGQGRPRDAGVRGTDATGAAGRNRGETWGGNAASLFGRAGGRGDDVAGSGVGGGYSGGAGGGGGGYISTMNGALNDSRFWAAHYYLLLADDEHDSAELIQPLFGISAEKLYEYYFNELVKPDGQATPIWLPLGNGYQVGVEYAECGEDGHEVRYFLGHSDGSAPELLGFDSPHFALPAFR